MAVSFQEFSGDGNVSLVEGPSPTIADLPEKRGLFSKFAERFLSPSAFEETINDVGEGGIAVHESFKKRAKTMNEILTAKERGEQGFARSTYQTAGQIVGGATDIVGAAAVTGAKMLLKQEEEDKIRDNFIEFVQGVDVPFTEKDIPTLMEDYDKWAEKNPALARDLSAGTSILEFLFDVGVLKTTVSIPKKVSEAIGKSSRRSDAELMKSTREEILTGKVPTFKDLAGKPNELVDRMKKSYAIHNTEKAVFAEQELLKTYNDLFDVKKGMREKLTATTERVDFMRENGLDVRDPQQLLTEAHIIPEVDFGSQQFRTLDQAARLRSMSEDANEAIKRALKTADEQGMSINLNVVRDDTKATVATLKGITEKQRAQIIKQIDDEFNLAVEKYGVDIPYTRMQELKINAQGNTNYAKTNAEGSIENNKNKVLALVYRKQIEKGMDSIGLNEFNQVNRDIGDIQVAADFLKALDGQGIPNPEYAKNMRYVAALAGASWGGVLGAAPGWYGGVVVGNALRWHAVSSFTSRALLENTQAKYPDAYKQLLKQLDEVDKQRMLETSSTVPRSRTSQTE